MKTAPDEKPPWMSIEEWLFAKAVDSQIEAKEKVQAVQRALRVLVLIFLILAVLLAANAILLARRNVVTQEVRNGVKHIDQVATQIQNHPTKPNVDSKAVADGLERIKRIELILCDGPCPVKENK
jgi:hypothetical protein